MEIDRETKEENSRRIQIRFVTKLKAPYKVPTTAIAIPSDLSRLGLSSIVNKLLQAGKNYFYIDKNHNWVFVFFSFWSVRFKFLKKCGGVLVFELKNFFVIV